jgi:hypothetical protein
MAANRSTLTPTDLIVLETLTWRIRVAPSEQLRQAVGQGVRSWNRRCERLTQQQWIWSRVVVLPVISVVEPLLSSWPGDAAPDFEALSWHVTHRWTTAKRQSVRLLWASRNAEAIVGGKSGAERQPLQVVHDLGMASVFFQRRRRASHETERWLSEDCFRVLAPREARVKVPDAVIVDREGRVQTAIEFAGCYSATRLRRLFQHCQRRRWRFELW